MIANPAAAVFLRLVRTITIAMSPLIVVSAGFWLLAAATRYTAWLVDLAGQVTAFLVGGVLCSYLIHETAHLAALAFCRGLRRIDVQCTSWRISLAPQGDLDPRAALLVAVAGPGICLLIGTLLLIGSSASLIAWCYLAHVIFLIPFFGDGRTIVVTIRHMLSRATTQ